MKVKYSGGEGSDDEIVPSAALSDLFLGLAGIVLVWVIVFAPFVQSRPKSLVEPEVARIDIEKTSIPFEIKKRLFHISPEGVTFHGEAGLIVVPYGEMLGNTVIEQVLEDIRASDNLPFLMVQDGSGEAAFLMDIMLAKSKIQEVERTRLKNSCKSIESIRAHQIQCRDHLVPAAALQKPKAL